MNKRVWLPPTCRDLQETDNTLAALLILNPNAFFGSAAAIHLCIAAVSLFTVATH